MSDVTKTKAPHVLVLWNQVDEDVYEKWKELGPQPLPWDPTQTASEVGTVQDEIDQLVEAVRANGFRVTCVNVEDSLSKLEAALALYTPDCVFNLVEFFHDDSALEPAVAALYDLTGMPYTGNPAWVLATCQSKVRTKSLLAWEGLPTAHWLVARPGAPIPDPSDPEHGLEYPLIVKPAREDASGGISPASVVQDYEALCERCRYVFEEFDQPALVEEYIEGREIHVALLGNFVRGKRKPRPEGAPPDAPVEWEVAPRTPEVLPLFEMEFDDDDIDENGEWQPQIISYDAKWDPHSKQFYKMDAVCPAEDLDPYLERRIRETALEAYRVMGCRDYARVDMRVDEEEGEIYILEVNPNPDLADGSAYIMCSDASGRTYAQVIGEIVRMALARGRRAAEGPKHREDTDHLLRKYRQTGFKARAQTDEGGEGGEGSKAG